MRNLDKLFVTLATAAFLVRAVDEGTDVSVLLEIIGSAAERLMALEVRGLTGAPHGHRNRSAWFSATAGREC